jgi:hypothetical protein
MLASWLRSLAGMFPHIPLRRVRPAARPQPPRPRLEQFEPRVLPDAAAARLLEDLAPPPLTSTTSPGTDPTLRLVAPGQDYGLSLSAQGAALSLPGTGDVLHVELVNPAKPASVGVNRSNATSTTYLPGGTVQATAEVAGPDRVVYRDVYAGIDLAYYGNSQGQLEYDFIVQPGADPGIIVQRFGGASGLDLDAEGNLIVHSAAGADVLVSAPVLYQQADDGSRQRVAGSFVLLGGDEVGYQVGAYDPTRTLVIDPTVTTTANSGTGSLRSAINTANGSPGSTIDFNIPTTDSGYSNGVWTITLSSALPTITANTTITGLGASTLTIDANSHEAFVIGTAGESSAPTVNISGMYIENGSATFGGAISNVGKLTLSLDTCSNNSAAYGGAVYSKVDDSGNSGSGSLTLNRDEFDSNSASGEGGAVNNYNNGTVAVNESAFTFNSAVYGGAIGNEYGTVTTTNSTFYSNSATKLGGAIANNDPVPFT